MKNVIFAAVLLICGLGAVFFVLRGREQDGSSVVSAESNAASTDPRAKHPVLVELFTSEGCSSCPPADRLLTSLRTEKIGNAETITLSYHVDYWNSLGWKDRFSSAEFTRRQEAYARQFRLGSSYTPQMVVNGTAEFVGSNRAKANDVIGNATSEVVGTIDLTINGRKLTADIQGLPGRSDATVYLAVAESGLFTKVGGGENSGSTLEHSSVVRHFVPIGKIKNGESTSKIERDLPQNSEWRTENVKYVVFVQDNATLRVLAVAAAK